MITLYGDHMIKLDSGPRKNNSSIDFEIILRDNEGNNVGNFIVNDIHVNDQLVEVVRYVINTHMYHFGVQVSNFV